MFPVAVAVVAVAAALAAAAVGYHGMARLGLQPRYLGKQVQGLLPAAGAVDQPPIGAAL